MELTKSERYMLHYIRHYPEWVSDIETISTARAISYDGDRVQTSPDDVMLNIAIRIEEDQEKIDKVERCLMRVFDTDNLINQMRGVFCYGCKVKMRRQTFCRMRRAFASELVKEFKPEENDGRNYV